MSTSTTQKPETVTAKLRRLQGVVENGNAEEMAEARRELKALRLAGGNTADRRDKLVAKIDAASQAAREAEAPAPAGTPARVKRVPAAPKPSVFPENLSQVEGIGKLATEKNGTSYGLAPWRAEYHTGKSSTGCTTCGETAVWSLLTQPKDGKVRALRAYCETHGRQMAAKYKVPLPKGAK